MSNLNPLEGTYRIKNSAAGMYSKLHSSYEYQIVDSKGESAFIAPAASIKTGKVPTFHQEAKLVCWAMMGDLEQV